MNYREPIDRLKTMRDRDLIAVAEKTGLSIWTLRSIRAGRTPNPRIDTMDALQGYFSRKRTA